MYGLAQDLLTSRKLRARFRILIIRDTVQLSGKAGRTAVSQESEIRAGSDSVTLIWLRRNQSCSWRKKDSARSWIILGGK